MSVPTATSPLRIPFGILGEPRLLAGSSGAPVPVGEHRRLHPAAPRLRQAELEQLCDAVNLRGRGGAGFPVADKLRSLGHRGAGRRVVVVNASESEPSSSKDLLLMSTFPHLVLDGAETVAAAVRATQIRVVVHEGRLAVDVERALAERRADRSITVDVLPGGFVAGEARAIVRGLNGGPALPPGRRLLPTQHGVGGAPTFLSNAETFAQLAVLTGRGPAAYASVGTAAEPGTTLFSVAGAVARPGVFEAPFGTDLADLLAVAHARPAAAVAVGGYHGTWLAPTGGIALSRAGLNPQRASLGAGVVLVLDEQTCPLGELARVASWLASESARQCGPCRFGLPALAADLMALVQGERGADRLARRHLDAVDGRGACAHPDGSARFVRSGLERMRHEVDLHLRHRGGCGRPILGQLPLTALGAW